MRTILLISVLVTVFGTGCGGCADEDKGNGGGGGGGNTNTASQGQRVPGSPVGMRKQSLVGRVDLSTFDAGAVDQ